MKARYNKYIDTDPKKAYEYLLCDLQDTSRYVSAQAYTDNVMNVALPSTYRFMEKVIQEIVAMYKEAGVPLTTIHLGGDEVARGALARFTFVCCIDERTGNDKGARFGGVFHYPSS